MSAKTRDRARRDLMSAEQAAKRSKPVPVTGTPSECEQLIRLRSPAPPVAARKTPRTTLPPEFFSALRAV